MNLRQASYIFEELADWYKTGGTPRPAQADVAEAQKWCIERIKELEGKLNEHHRKNS